MKTRALRHLIIALLTLTGIFQLLVAMLGGAPGFGLILASFGALYVALGFFARSDTKDGSKSHSRNAIIAAVAACVFNLGLCAYVLQQAADAASLFVIAAADLAIITAAVLWLMKAGAKKRR
jgi:hypothetical protein